MRRCPVQAVPLVQPATSGVMVPPRQIDDHCGGRGDEMSVPR